MDPISFTASVLTLLGAAGGSCKFLYNFILDISDAPDEILSQNVKLRGLHQTILNLIRVYDSGDLPPELALDPALRMNILHFIKEIDIIKSKIQSKGNALGKGRVHLLWERVKWLLSDRQLHKFYSSLDNWNMIFTNAVNATEMELSIRIHNKITTLMSMPPKVCADKAFQSHYIEHTVKPDQRQHLRIYKGPLDEEKQQVPKYVGIISPDTTRSKRLQAYVSRMFEPIGSRTQHWITCTGDFVSADLRLGLVIVRYWCPTSQDLYDKSLSYQDGCCVSSTIRMNRIIHGRLSFVVFALYKIRSPFQISTRWNLSVSGMLLYDSPAYLACKSGDWVVLRKLLAHGKAKISDVTAYGDTLLHIAASSNHFDLIKELLLAGVDVNATNDFGETPLHMAVERDCEYETSQRLISNGADLTLQDRTGRTPLHYFFNKASQNIIEFHQDELDKAVEDFRGMTIAHYVAWSKTATTADILRCLTDKTSAIENTDEEGRTIMHLALQRGNLALVEHMLHLPNPPVLRPDLNGRTPLHYATESRRVETIDMLLSKGVDPHARDLKGRSALHHAASQGKLDAVKRLLILGASNDLVALDNGSRTPLQLAMLEKRDSVVNYLKPLCPPQWLEDLKETTFDDGQQMTMEKGWVSLRYLVLVFLVGMGLLFLFYLHESVGVPSVVPSMVYDVAVRSRM